MSNHTKTISNKQLLDKSKYKKQLSSWILVSLWMLVIFAFSSISTIPSSQIFWQDFVIKKTAHFVEFFILTLLIFRAALVEGPPTSKTYLYSFVIALIYAISDELHQKSTPGRQPSIRDVVIDAVGIVASLYFVANMDRLTGRFPRLLAISKFIKNE